MLRYFDAAAWAVDWILNLPFLNLDLNCCVHTTHTSDLVFNQYFRNDIFVIEPVMKSDVFILWKYGIRTTMVMTVKNSQNRFQNDFFLCWWMAVNQNPPHITKCCCPLVWTVDTNIVIVNFIVIILGVNKRTKNEKISLVSYLSWHLLSFRPN